MTFLDVLCGETIKTLTSRAVTLTALISVLVSLGYCLLDASPDLGLATPQSAGIYSMANFSFFAAITGVLVVSSEYAGGQLTVTALAVPCRGKVLAAKLILSAAIATALALVLAFLIATIVQAPLGSRSVWATGTQGELATSLALAVVSWTGVGIISTCMAVLIQSHTLALSIMIVLSFGGTPLMMAVPLLQYLPTNAGTLMFIDRENQTSEWLNPPDITVPAAGLTLAAWCALAIGAATVVQLRRDIGAHHAALG